MRLICSISLYLILCHSVQAQVFLQIEKLNSPKTIKLVPGDILEFTLKEYPDVWRKEEIHKIIYEENLVVLDEGYRKIDEFKKIRLYRPWAKKTGYGLLQFSGGWYLFGGIATIADQNYTISGGEILIGAIFAGVGFLVKKLFYKKTLDLEKKTRLRIVDISFFNNNSNP